MAKTKVDFEQITTAANNISIQVELLNDANTKLDEAKEKLGVAWKDTSSKRNAERYLQKVEETQTKLKQMVEVISELPGKLKKYAEDYAAAAGEAEGGNA